MANTLKTLTVILISLYFNSSEASPTQISKTVTDPSRCHHSLEDQNLPHESDCSRYYRCVYGKKVPKICQEKMLFNPDIGNCDLYYNVDCPFTAEDETNNGQNSEEAIEHLTGTTFNNKKKFDTSVSELDDNTTMEGGNTATITKSGDTATTKFVYMPHEFDQAAYYQIENGERNLVYCEEGMVFSIDMEICARPWDFV